MPTAERRSISQSLSAVASKSRRLFSRELNASPSSSSSSECVPRRDQSAATPHSLSPSPYLHSNRGAFTPSPLPSPSPSPSPSPYCIGKQLLSPPLDSHSSFGKAAGRRRSSTTTTGSNHSAGGGGEDAHRRKRSLFSTSGTKKGDSNSQNAQHGGMDDAFNDPFETRPWFKQQNAKAMAAIHESHRAAAASGAGATKQLLSQEEKLAALDRVSDLVCMSVESQVQQGSLGSLASSPTFSSSSPTLCGSGADTFFYPVDAPPSPQSPQSARSSSFARSNGSPTRPRVVAFPTPSTSSDTMGNAYSSAAPDAAPKPFSTSAPLPMAAPISVAVAVAPRYTHFARNQSKNQSEMFEIVQISPKSTSDGFASTHFAQPLTSRHEILLPSSMKSPKVGANRSTASQQLRTSNAAKKTKPPKHHDGRERLGGRRPDDDYFGPGVGERRYGFIDRTNMRESSLPLPPLRPSRNVSRSRAQSLSASSSLSTTKSASDRSHGDSTTTPPLPTVPANFQHLVSRSDSRSGASMLFKELDADAAARKEEVEPLSFLETPPRSRPPSLAQSRKSRSDSLSSIGDYRPAPFSTPTFGVSGKWSSLP
ncbi:hypothetical protein BCV70DRAFT_218168 [Testicularia cyperi]|uniref:Uncharacterized protein n=1 Tax=Testicularia cyperi TaxID=1882483 RepID=A0A317XP93_9BASI|nr:hypothetical protein BCV70DRAFT_218168 [Testicularia cyperi]